MFCNTNAFFSVFLRHMCSGKPVLADCACTNSSGDCVPLPIGSVAVEHDGGAYTMALYFTSEAAAREGERKEPPPELKALMEEMDALNVGEPEFFDLKQPWLYAPR